MTALLLFKDAVRETITVDLVLKSEPKNPIRC